MAYNQEPKASLEAWEKEEFISLGMDRLNLNHRQVKEAFVNIRTFIIGELTITREWSYFQEMREHWKGNRILLKNLSKLDLFKRSQLIDHLHTPFP